MKKRTYYIATFALVALMLLINVSTTNAAGFAIIIPNGGAQAPAPPAPAPAPAPTPTPTPSVSSSSTSGGGGGGGVPGASAGPTRIVSGSPAVTVPAAGKGGKAVTSRAVTLAITAPTGTKQMVIANDVGFKGALKEKVNKTKKWDLCSRSGGKVKLKDCKAGDYIVYVKFFDAQGKLIKRAQIPFTLKPAKKGAMNVVDKTSKTDSPFTTSILK